jgi:hypothetical protein
VQALVLQINTVGPESLLTPATVIQLHQKLQRDRRISAHKSHSREFRKADLRSFRPPLKLKLKLKCFLTRSGGKSVAVTDYFFQIRDSLDKLET